MHLGCACKHKLMFLQMANEHSSTSMCHLNSYPTNIQRNRAIERGYKGDPIHQRTPSTRIPNLFPYNLRFMQRRHQFAMMQCMATSFGDSIVYLISNPRACIRRGRIMRTRGVYIFSKSKLHIIKLMCKSTTFCLCNNNFEVYNPVATFN